MSDLISSNYSDKDPLPRLHKKLNHLDPFYRSFFISFFLFQAYRTNFMSLLKLAQILVRVPLVIIERIIIKLLWEQTELAPYHIKRTISSTTTQVFFAHSKLTGIDICMKLWPKRRAGDSGQEDSTTQLMNLLEGFAFNQRFAPGVYLGIAPIDKIGEGAQIIRRGDLIFKPSIDNLPPGEYVIVMRNVQKEWKLDYRLSSKGDSLRTKKGMDFLAREVAHMHKQLEALPQENFYSSVVASKLAFNSRRLGQAVQSLGDAYIAECYAYICRVMNIVYEKYISYFDWRTSGGHVKRCHGDLKATNLWVSPGGILPRKLFALDCIDFNPDFCRIDTLSDTAMLAVSIQQVMTESGECDGEELTLHFLEAYCQEMRESDACVQALLKYYMTEKAMVCSYVSVLLDNSLELGKRYFAIAHQLAKQLEQMPDPADPKSSSELALALLTSTT